MYTFFGRVVDRCDSRKYNLAINLGDFGNKFSASYSPVESPSTTQPLNAMFDGQNYYYMPWRDIKPCIMLISHWEDNTFRIESLNMILKTINKLVW